MSIEKLREFTNGYIETHYPNVSEREKTIIRNAVHIGYEYANSPIIEWEKGIEIDVISSHDKAHMIFGYDQFGKYWEATGHYSCGELVCVEDATMEG